MGPVKNVSVVGGGAWGTTLAMIAANNQLEVKQWTHADDHRKILTQTRINPLLPDIKIPESITYYSTFTSNFFDCNIIILVVASEFFRSTLLQLKPLISPGTILVSATKGLEKQTAKTPYDILNEEFPDTAANPICILSGPNIALEIAQQKPAASVVASANKIAAQSVQLALSNKYFRVYISPDIQGVEIGGILKNVIAIAAGIADGLGLGNNSKSTLMVRGIYEIIKYARKKGANPETLLGLAGMGDLITTCSSPLSRNFQTGVQLAKGHSLEEILANLGSIAEGVRTAKIIQEDASRLGIEMPIIEQIYHVLYNHLSPQQAIENLMTRKLKSEFEDHLS